MGSKIKVAQTKDLPPGKGLCVDVGGEMVALFNVDGKYYAIEDACSHQGGPLSEGDLDGTTVTCPWHAATFDITTGEATSPPAHENLKTFVVHVEGGDILIEESS